VDGFTLAHVARLLRLEQKPLYRRVERLVRTLRASLEAEGVSAAEVRELLGSDSSPALMKIKTVSEPEL
jgi:RNA polymerase sigma factor for flagellar operon FliA